MGDTRECSGRVKSRYEEGEDEDEDEATTAKSKPI
jgi:hypothetical protein